MNQWFSSNDALILAINCLFAKLKIILVYFLLWNLQLSTLIDLPLTEFKLHYNSSIKTILYGSSTWNTALEENIQCVSKLQKQVVHVILDADVRERSERLFKLLHWLQLKDKVNLLKCRLIFRSMITKMVVQAT